MIMQYKREGAITKLSSKPVGKRKIQTYEAFGTPVVVT